MSDSNMQRCGPLQQPVHNFLTNVAHDEALQQYVYAIQLSHAYNHFVSVIGAVIGTIELSPDSLLCVYHLHAPTKI